MAKKRTMNELRQSKEYKIDPVQQVLAQQIEELAERDHQEGTKAEVSRCPLDPVEEAKILIVDKITKHFQDIMFEMVHEEMSKNYLFQSQNYLTEAGFELFEDEYFEFYHNHHGDILYEVWKNITYTK